MAIKSINDTIGRIGLVPFPLELGGLLTFSRPYIGNQTRANRFESPKLTERDEISCHRIRNRKSVTIKTTSSYAISPTPPQT